MRTLDTLYNNKLTGLFPDQQAIPATTPTAKDGTPLKAINIDDLVIGPIQALFHQTGSAIPDGNPELKDASQIIDLMRQLFSTAEKQTINASGPVVFGPTNHEVEVDLSLGNVSIDQLPVPDFIGQKPHIYGVGSGIGDIAGGTGLYVNNIFFTENTGGVFLDAVSLTEFRAVPGVTADYVSGNFDLKFTSSGNMEANGKFSKNDGLTTAQVFNYPIAFAVVPNIVANQVDASFTTEVAITAISAISFSVIVKNSGAGTATTSTRAFHQLSEEKY